MIQMPVCIKLTVRREKYYFSLENNTSSYGKYDLETGAIINPKQDSEIVYVFPEVLKAIKKHSEDTQEQNYICWYNNIVREASPHEVASYLQE